MIGGKALLLSCIIPTLLGRVLVVASSSSYSAECWSILCVRKLADRRFTTVQDTFSVYDNLFV